MEQNKLTFEQLPDAVSEIRTMLAELKKPTTVQFKNDLDDWSPMNIEEAALYIKRAVGTIHNLVKQDKIPHHKNGTLYFFKPELIEWIKEGRASSTPDLPKSFGKRGAA